MNRMLILYCQVQCKLIAVFLQQQSKNYMHVYKSLYDLVVAVLRILQSPVATVISLHFEQCVAICELKVMQNKFTVFAN